MCEVNKTDAPEPVDQMKKELYAEAARIKEKLYSAEKQQAHERHLQNAASSIDWSAQTNTGAPADLATGMAPEDFGAVGRAPLRERVARRQRHAAEASAHHHTDKRRCIELARLLAANPDVARILELLEETGV